MTDRFDFSDAQTTVKAYARPTLLLDPVDSKITTLQTLADIGVVDDLSVTAWPGTVRLAGADVHGETLATFDRFESWASAHGVALPRFEKEIVVSDVLDQPQTVLHTPTVALELEVDDRLVAVFPHTDGETEYTVTEAIAAMRTDSLELEAIDAVGVQEESATCPDCDGELESILGVAVCRDCSWNGRLVEWETEGESRRVVRPAK